MAKGARSKAAPKASKKAPSVAEPVETVEPIAAEFRGHQTWRCPCGFAHEQRQVVERHIEVGAHQAPLPSELPGEPGHEHDWWKVFQPSEEAEGDPVWIGAQCTGCEEVLTLEECIELGFDAEEEAP